jgi:hypothetical protein
MTGDSRSATSSSFGLAYGWPSSSSLSSASLSSIGSWFSRGKKP